MEEELKEQQDYSRLRPWQFKKGQSGNPLGRPPGRSLKDRAKAYLSGLSDEEAMDFFEGIDKKTVWEMAEGKATAEITGKDGKDLIPETDVTVKELTEKLNAIHRGTSIGGDGGSSSVVGTEASDQN